MIGHLGQTTASSNRDAPHLQITHSKPGGTTRMDQNQLQPRCPTCNKGSYNIVGQLGQNHN
jgi:hypothetical protein